MRCLNCKYDLRNLAEHRCPECGREFDPKEAKTYQADRDGFWPRAVVVKNILGYSYLISFLLTLIVHGGECLYEGAGPPSTASWALWIVATSIIYSFIPAFFISLTAIIFYFIVGNIRSQIGMK